MRGLKTGDPLKSVGTHWSGEQGFRWTCRRHCENVGPRDTGGPTSGILWVCWGQCATRKRAPPPQGQPTPTGDRPKHRRASTQDRDLVSGTLSSYFLTLSVPSCWLVSGRSQCGRSWCVLGSFALLTYLLPVGGRGTLCPPTSLCCVSTCPSSGIMSVVSPGQVLVLWLSLILFLRVHCRCLHTVLKQLPHGFTADHSFDGGPRKS